MPTARTREPPTAAISPRPVTGITAGDSGRSTTADTTSGSASTSHTADGLSVENTTPTDPTGRTMEARPSSSVTSTSGGVAGAPPAMVNDAYT